MPSGFFVEAIGSIAAFTTTFCWVPQALKVLRTRDTRAISIVTQSMMLFGIVLWLGYGVMINSWPLIGSNLVSGLLVGAIFALKLRYG